MPRGLYSRVAVTPLASSPWPAHAIYLSRLRDSSPLSFFLALLTLLLSPVSVQRSVAASAQLHHSCSEALPRSAFGVDVSSGHIFVTSPRTARARIFHESDSSQFTRVLLESTFLLQFKLNLGLSRRDLDYLRYYTAAHFSQTIDSTSRQHVSRVCPMALIINYLLIP